MTIEKIGTGYLIQISYDKRAYETIEELFQYMLLHYEGKAETFLGDSYGKVIVKNRN